VDDRKVKRLGFAGYARSIHPLKRLSFYAGAVLAFDTEYESKSRKLISFQLCGEKSSLFLPIERGGKLTVARLFAACVKTLGDMPDEVLLVTYFSPAEIQFLPLLREGFNVREYARGSLDCSFRAGQSVLHIFDLARWYDGRSLAAAAESIGEKKLDWARSKVTRADLRKPGFRAYALRDAEITFRLFTALRVRFKESTGVDIVESKTPAGASAAAFRRLHVKRGRLYCDDNDARRAALFGTWGGRAEVFERGRLKGEFTEYDISSAYPRSVLALGKLPVQGSWRELRNLQGLGKWRGGFLHVRFGFRTGTRFPCLPVNCQEFLLYPLEGRSWATLDEVKLALEMGARVSLLEGRVYRDGTRALADYMQWALDSRAKVTGAAQTMFKLLANSLIGKFAQAIDKIPLGEYWRIAEEGGFCLDELFELSPRELQALGVKSTVSLGPVFMPEWNGLITGRTRATLGRMLNAATRPIYCHTDSVWARALPANDFGLPVERKICGEAVVIRTRFAALGLPATFKRARSGAAHVAHHSVWNLVTACQMLSRFDGRDFSRHYPIDRPLRVREAARSGRVPGSWVTEWRTAGTKWDCKRALLPHGETRPWECVEDFLKNSS
jgi:hypothetical protein